MSDVFALDPASQAQKDEAAATRGARLGDTGPAFWDNPLEGIESGLMRGGARTAQFIGLAGAVPVGFVAEAIGGRQYGEDVTDRYFKGLDNLVTNAVDYWTPDPATVGKAGQVLGGLSEIALPLMAGGGNPTLLLGSTVFGGAADLVRQGVDPTTAVGVGTLEGAAAAAGFRIPFLGRSLATRMLSGAAGNLAINTGATAASRAALELQGYPDQAGQFDPMDPTARAVDVATGLAFGGLHHLGERRVEKGPRSLTGDERAALMTGLDAEHYQEQTAPGRPVGPGAWSAHADAMDQAFAALLRGDQVVAPPEIEAADFLPRATEPASAPAELEPDLAFLNAGGETMNIAPPIAKPGRAAFAAIDARPLPDLATLPKEPTAYLAPTESSQVVPIDRLVLTKTDTEASGDNAIKRFAAAAAGEIPKRAPVTVRELPDGTYSVLDGNGTVTALRKMGVREAIVEVDKSAAAARPLNTDEQLRARLAELENLDAAAAPPELRTQLAELYNVAAQVKPTFDSIISEISRQVGSKIEPEIADLKSAARAAEKAVKEYAGNAADVRDLVRATILIESGEQLQRAMQLVIERFGEPVNFRNWLDPAFEPRDGYRDVKFNVRVGDHIAELQLNFPAMAAAKEANHVFYEERRTIQGDAAKEGRGLSEFERKRVDELDKKMAANYAVAWRSDLKRLKAASVKGAPSSSTALSENALPSGTSQASTETPPLPSGSAETGTPRTDQNIGSLPIDGRLPTESSVSGSTLPAAQVVITSAGRKLQVRPRLVEAADLVTSDREGYPQELQPRQRGARKALAGQVANIAAHLEPTLLGPSATADTGAPITGQGNVVESGNGRVMALREVYAHYPEKAAAYRAYLESLGLDTTGMAEPVLVRERVTELSSAERRAFTVEANTANVASMSPVERAQADARLIDEGALSQLRGDDFASANNAGFVRAFLAQIHAGERNALQNPDGTLSQEGVRRIQAAVLAKAYGGTPESNAVLGRMLESTDADMRSALGAMIDAAPAFAKLRQEIADGKVGPEYDVSRFLTQAIENVGKLRASGSSLHDFLQQQDMLTSRPPIVDEIMRALYDRKGERLAGREKVAAALTDYASQAGRQRLDQGALFAEPAVPPEKLLAGVGPRAEPAAPKVVDMFGLRTPQGGAPKADPVVDAARQAAEERPGLKVPAGDTGTTTAAELVAKGEADQARAENDAKAFEVAASCFLRNGTD